MSITDWRLEGKKGKRKEREMSQDKKKEKKKEEEVHRCELDIDSCFREKGPGRSRLCPEQGACLLVPQLQQARVLATLLCEPPVLQNLQSLLHTHI